VRRALGAFRAAGRWASIATSRPAREGVAVFYGHRRVPAPGEPVAGGMVKFQRLQEAFPNRIRDFNVLYLGSSSLPLDWRMVLRLAERRGARIVVNQDGVAYPAWAGERTGRLNARLRRLLLASDHVLYQSDFCKRAADEFLGEAGGSWEVLPNAVDTRLFTPADEPPAEGPVLILAGDQTQAYRLETALRTLALVARERPDARLLVTGSLVEDGGRRLVRELRLEERVELSGRYAQRDAPALYRRAHLLLHTKRNDPCPNVVLEALSCGLPVVHSASGGLPELVGAEAGIGIPDEGDWEHDVPPDPEALAAGVVSVLDRLDGYRAAARARAVERFDLQPWIDRHRLLFAALVERR
jgi:glycosyltransferase involved in cell wall biosynthesis